MVAEADTDPDTVDGAPLPVNQWKFRRFALVDRPVTGAVNSAMDTHGNLWVVFATGRLWGLQDYSPCSAVNDSAPCLENHEQYLFGIKEDLIGGRMTFKDQTPYLAQGLVDVSGASVYASGLVTGLPGAATYADAQALMLPSTARGYKRRLNMVTILTGKKSHEISDTQPKIASVGTGRSIVAFTSYEPSGQSCGDMGDSYMYVLDTFTGLPPAYLAEVFRAASSGEQPPTTGPGGQADYVVTGGVHVGSGENTGATITVVGGKVIVSSKNEANESRELPITSSLALPNNVISWREVFNTGFTLPKEMMIEDLEIEP
jgi:Tfp pilus tip-associated adhesin PilY1